MSWSDDYNPYLEEDKPQWSSFQPAGKMEPTGDQNYGILRYLGDLLSQHNAHENEMTKQAFSGQLDPAVFDWLGDKAKMMGIGMTVPEGKAAAQAGGVTLKDMIENLSGFAKRWNNPTLREAMSPGQFAGYMRQGLKRGDIGTASQATSDFTLPEDAMEGMFKDWNPEINRFGRAPYKPGTRPPWLMSNDEDLINSVNPSNFEDLASRVNPQDDIARRLAQQQAQRELEWNDFRTGAREAVRDFGSTPTQTAVPFQEGRINRYLETRQPFSVASGTQLPQVIPWNRIADAIPDWAWGALAAHPALVTLGAVLGGGMGLQHLLPQLSLGESAKSSPLQMARTAITDSGGWGEPSQFDAEGNLKSPVPVGHDSIWKILTGG